MADAPSPPKVVVEVAALSAAPAEPIITPSAITAAPAVATATMPGVGNVATQRAASN